MGLDGTFPPLVLAALFAIVFVVLAVLVGRQLLRRRRRPPGRVVRPGRPAPDEIWIADVPFADGTGSKVRPCLIVRAHRSGVDVLKITSQDKHARPDHVRIETRSWDPHAAHDSYLDLSTALPVREAGLHRKVGVLTDARVRRLVHRRHPARGVSGADGTGPGAGRRGRG